MKHKVATICVLAVLVVLLIIPVSAAGTVSTWDGSVASGFAGGRGTVQSPYLIKTAAQLAYLADSINSGVDLDECYFSLEADLDLNEINWTPIGSDNRDTRFEGVFLGNGHVISNLYISNASSSSQGLFGVAYDATIQELHLKDAFVRGNEKVGGICGQFNGDKLYKCSVTGKVVGAKQVGGIAGSLSADYVSDCTNAAQVSGSGSFIGGIVGWLSSDLSRCVNTGTISSSGNTAGGIAGYGSTATISDCFNAGSVTASTSSAGGIAGDGETIVNCGNIGTIKANYRAGGIAGEIVSGSVSNCYNAGSVKGLSTYKPDAGGIVGYLLNGNVVAYNLPAAVMNGVGYSSGSSTTIYTGYTAATMASSEFAATLNSGIDTDLYTPWAQSPQYYDGYPYFELRTVQSVTLTKSPDIVTYLETVPFSGEGMELTAVFDDGSSGPLGSYTVSPSGGLSVSDRYVTISSGAFSIRIPVTVKPIPFEGSGTKSSPYLIDSREDLMAVSQLCLASEDCDHYLLASYQQTADIALDISDWIPIGASNVLTFSGSYRGGLYTISGLKMDGSGNTKTAPCGLFGCVSGEISGIVLKDSTVEGGAVAGGIAGICAGSVMLCSTENVSVSGSGTGNFAGGIVGTLTNGGTLTSCTTEGSVEGYYAGGIAGAVAGDSFVIGCENGAEVVGNGPFAGGISSGFEAGSGASECVNRGAVYAEGSAGGVTGTAQNVVFVDCANYGTVTAAASNSAAAGIAANVTGGVISKCSNFGTIQGTRYAGGICGYGMENSSANTDVQIDTCLNAGDITATTNSSTAAAGGIYASQNTSMAINCVNSGAVSGYGDVGGIAGETFEGCVIYNCANTGAVMGKGYNYTGGIAGYAGSVAIQSCYSTGSITGNYAGALAGNFYSYYSTSSKCYYLSGSANRICGSGSGASCTAMSADQMRTAAFAATLTSGNSYSGCNAWERNTVTNSGYPVPGEWFLRTLTAMEILSLPDELGYHVDELLDVTGLHVQGTLDDGSVVDLTALCEITSDSLSSPGTKLVTVQVDDCTETFEVYVYGIADAEFSEEGVTLTYAFDGDQLEASTFVLAAYRENGKMLGCDMADILVDGEQHRLFVLCKAASKAYLFQLNEDQAPVCAAKPYEAALTE